MRRGAIDDVTNSLILGRLGFMPRIHNTLLDGLPLWNAIRLMERMGTVAARAARLLTWLGGEVSKREQLAAGYGVFADGAAGFCSFLDDLAAATRIEPRKTSHWLSYERLIIEWKTRDLRDAIHEPIRKLVSEHSRKTLGNDPLLQFL